MSSVKKVKSSPETVAYMTLRSTANGPTEDLLDLFKIMTLTKRYKVEWREFLPSEGGFTIQLHYYNEHRNRSILLALLKDTGLTFSD